MSTKTEQAIVEVIIKGQQSNATLKELEASGRALRAQLSRLPIDSQEFVKKSAELQKVNTRLQSIRDDIKGTGSAFQWLGKEMKAFGILAIGALGFTWLTGKVQNIIQGNAQLSDSFADIQKTTGMTDREVRRLNTSLNQLDTRTSAKELREVAVAAGQLGIAKSDVLKFTAATDKMVVTLKDEFPGGAAEVTTVMGKLRNIFSDIKSAKIDQDMLHIGNAINVLAKDGIATGDVVSDFAMRIGAVGSTLGLTSGQVLGLSATLQEMGVTTERGGTAVSKILLKMTTHVNDFAKVASMEAKDFAHLVNTDLFGAFIKVVEGSQKGGASATAFAGILDTLGTEGAGVSEVMSKMGKNTEMLKAKVDLASGALKNTDSIMNTFNLKNKTLGADMDKLGKGLAVAFTNPAVTKGLQGLIHWMAELVDNTKKVSENMEDERQHVNSLVIELKESNTTNERRKEIYEELRAINPDIVAGLDKENIQMERLNKNIDDFNAKQQQRILIQRKQEEIDKQAEKSADALDNRLTREEQARQSLVKVLEAQGSWTKQLKDISDNTKLNLLEKLEQARDVLKAIAYSNGQIADPKAHQQVVDLNRAITNLAQTERSHNAQTDIGNKLIKEKSALKKRFNLEVLDYSKKTEQELKEIIQENNDSRGMFARESAAAQEELKSRVNKSSKDTKWVDLDALKEAEKLAKEHAKEILRIYKDLQKDLMKYFQDANFELMSFGLSDYQKEAAKVLREHDEMMSRIEKDEELRKRPKEKEAMVVAANKATNDKLMLLDKKYNAEAEKAMKEHLKAFDEMTHNARENEISAVIEKYDKEIEFFKDNTEKVKELENAKQLAIEEIKGKYAEKKDQPNLHGLSKRDQLVAELNQALNVYKEFYGSLSQLQSAWMNLQQMDNQDQTDRIELQAQRKIEAEKHRLDADQINQDQYNKRVDQINHEKVMRERRLAIDAAQQQKRFAIFNATLNSAEAITEIWAKWAANPIIAGILTGIAVASLATQMAVINRQAVPKFATGGFVGSETMMQSASGRPFIAGERGAEWVAPNWMLQHPITANTIGMLEAIREQRSFAAGGSTAVRSDAQGGSSRQSGSSSSGDFGSLVKAINRLNAHLDRGIDASLNYDDFTKTMKSIDSARSASAV